ncbi:MAG: LegC family aminotransferase [Desulfobacteraceae bacterium]|nr:LegC family aminotransferase [Desulfobacteraceae bacterium]
MFEDVVAYIRRLFPGRESIPLHEPVFAGRERDYVLAAIDSTFVSSVGKFVEQFEQMMSDYTGASYAVATVNGTSALHAALLVAGVKPGDEVITQSLTFVATANAITYCGAQPVFLDVDRDTLGLSPAALAAFLREHTEQAGEECHNKTTGRRISACVPMHSFGLPCRIEEIADLCQGHNLMLVEDAAESLGSTQHGRHAGTFGHLGVYSFNGNKTVTCGGGGAIVTSDKKFAAHAKHLTTTAKKPHPYRYEHDEVGFNYRMPNLNAALACAQLENLELFIADKRRLAGQYQEFFRHRAAISFVVEPPECRANYWLNTVLLADAASRDLFLNEVCGAGIQTRPAWELLNRLKIYHHCQTDSLVNANWLADRIVNLPSSVRL